jgi:hypothetical protein
MTAPLKVLLQNHFYNVALRRCWEPLDVFECCFQVNSLIHLVLIHPFSQFIVMQRTGKLEIHPAAPNNNKIASGFRGTPFAVKEYCVLG